MTREEQATKRVVMLAAVDRRGVLGWRGGLAWRLPSDLKGFRRRTLGKALIMGRVTWEGLGGPLKGRAVGVLTRREGWSAPGVEAAFGGLEEALAWAQGARPGTDEVIVAGGEQVYRQALAVADEVVVSELDAYVRGDCVFPLEALGDRARWCAPEVGAWREAGGRDRWRWREVVWRRKREG